MKGVVFATAGHVDHGKTSLVHALTGVWCDRLKEEQERGITLVLGFAPLLDPEGQVEVSFVDVPGHERLVHTMVAGAGAVDRALLVVAANEGVMPQTREHVAVLQLLGIQGGVVALTKADLVSPSELEARKAELAAFLRHGPLALAPIIPCSSTTGEGVQELKEAILRDARSVQRETEPHRPFRLAADRVFSLPGAGTVVTGTARWGQVNVGEDVWVFPPGRTLRVRSLQVHGQDRGLASAGERVALALVGVKAEEIPRGAQVVSSGPWEPTARVAVELTMLPEAPVLAEGQKLWLHLLAARTVATVERLSPQASSGRPGRALLRLANPLLAFPGDRVILRRMTPASTVGGGVVLDTSLPRLSRRGLPMLAELPPPGKRPALVWALVERSGRTGVSLSQLAAQLGFLPQGVQGRLGELEAQGHVVLLPGRDALVVSKRAVAEVLAEAKSTLKQRGELGLPASELLQALNLGESKALRAFYLETLLGQGLAQEQGGRLFAAELQPLTSPLAMRLEELYRKAGFAAPSPEEAATQLSAPPKAVEGLVKLLLDQGRLVRVGGKWILHRQVLDGIVASLRSWGVERFDVGQFKDRFGLTRKLAIPILEWLDSQRVTRREGDVRRILPTLRGTSSSG
ncbi:MAG: selenocysteine-specific translation elongation factor [Thermoanaerobaculum sp.]